MLLILLFQGIWTVDYIMDCYQDYVQEIDLEGAAGPGPLALLLEDIIIQINIIILIVLLVETVLYYRWRKRILNRAPALIHVSYLFVQCVVWTALDILWLEDIRALDPSPPSNGFSETFIIDVALVTIAHIAFVYLWRRGLQRTDTNNSKTYTKGSADGDWVEELHDLVD